MKRIGKLVLVIGVAIASAALVTAGDDDKKAVKEGEGSDQQKLIQKYIDDLASSTFAVRQHARNELEKIGKPAQKALRKVANSDDLQVRKTVGELLAALEITKLPGPVEDIAVAGSGQILVLKLGGQKGLTVYDAKTHKLATLDLPTTDFVFGAGGDMAVVFLKESNEIRSYSLKTLSQVKAKEFADPIIILRIVMGHSRGDLGLIRFARGTEELSQTTNQFLDVAALSILKPKGRLYGSGHNSSYRDYVHFRADGHLDRITEWASSHSPSGIGMFIRTEDGYQYRYSHNSAGYLVPGDDGLIYSGYGIIYSVLSEAKQPFNEYFGVAGKVEGMSLLPGLGGLFFLGIDRDGKLNVYQTGQTTPICPIAPFPDWSLPKPEANAGRQIPAGPFPPGQTEEWIRSSVTLDKRIVFAPAAGYILFLPPSNDRIIQRDFDLKDALEWTGKDYLLVLSNPPLRSKSGAKWDYQIRTLAKHGPVKFELETAPEGMSMSAAGDLTWKVPGGIQGKTHVVVAITDKKSSVIRHSFTVTFE
jgi:hypothetical protein